MVLTSKLSYIILTKFFLVSPTAVSMNISIAFWYMVARGDVQVRSTGKEEIPLIIEYRAKEMV